MPSRSLRVAVIGAGAAALVVARELRREGHAPVVFERTDGVGGIWVYDADASASADPLGSRPSNLYASLRTNLPRECMGFLDFPFAAAAAAGPDDDPRRFPGHAEVLRYLRDFARRFDLHGLVRFETEVVRVTREAAASWRVRYSSKLAGSEQCEAEEVFDAVVVCNGHYSQPHLADIPGMDAWPGEQLHSNSYRVPDPFHGQSPPPLCMWYRWIDTEKPEWVLREIEERSHRAWESFYEYEHHEKAVEERRAAQEEQRYQL